jgi:hypothetical protein
MTTLLGDIDAIQQVITVAAPGEPVRLSHYLIGEEIIQFQSTWRADMRSPEVATKWNVSRGQAGTMPAPHPSRTKVEPFTIRHPVSG